MDKTINTIKTIQLKSGSRYRVEFGEDVYVKVVRLDGRHGWTFMRNPLPDGGGSPESVGLPREMCAWVKANIPKR